MYLPENDRYFGNFPVSKCVNRSFGQERSIQNRREWVERCRSRIEQLLTGLSEPVNVHLAQTVHYLLAIRKAPPAIIREKKGLFVVGQLHLRKECNLVED